MIGLILITIIFNYVAFKTNKRLTANQIVHIWSFTIAFQTLFDTVVEFKYLGYWYFSPEVDWEGLLPHVFLLPPVNMIFLNFYPLGKKLTKQITYFIIFEVTLLLYELITMLPEPWGYFYYGWWTIGHSVFLNPILLLILLGYYKWVRKLERLLLLKQELS